MAPTTGQETVVDTTKPSIILSHTQDMVYNLVKVISGEVIAQQSTDDLDFDSLSAEFAHYGTDYFEPMSLDVGSMTLDFAKKMIFDVGPKSRQSKDDKGDKTYKFLFPDDNGKNKAVFVCTYRNTTYNKYSDDDRIVLTIKQAGLLAVEKFNQVSNLAMGLPEPKMLLTPLAGVEILSSTIKVPVSTLIKKINASCQPGGQYLNDSDGTLAVASSTVATKYIKDKNIAHQIITKTVKQYVHHSKDFDLTKFEKVAEFAMGGAPSNMNPLSLIETFDNAQKKISIRAELKASKETSGKSTVATPKPPAPGPKSSK